MEGGAYQYDFDTGTAVVIPFDCSVNNNGVLDGVMMPARIGNRYRLRNGYYYNRNYKNDSTGKTKEMNIYAQDSWKLTSNFPLSLGLPRRVVGQQGQSHQDPPRAPAQVRLR